MAPHSHAFESTATFSMVSLSLLTAVTIAYLAAAHAQRRSGRRWRTRCVGAWLIGAGLLGTALAPPVVEWAHHDLRGHMVQHLLIGMLAPLALVLAAPMTLLLRTVPVAAARRITTTLRHQPFRLLTHPVTAAGLNIGGMYVLYVTPLYAMSLHSPALHHLIHVHFFAAGYLFCWAILAGPDPAPHAPGFRFRLGVLFASIAAHAILGKLMYGYLWPRHTPHSIEEIQTAAQLMYYGGDLAELLLAVALFAMWYRTPIASRSSFLPDIAPHIRVTP